MQEEGADRLSPSSTDVAGKLEPLNLNTQAQSVCVRDEVVLRYRFHHHVLALAEAVWTLSYDCSR